MCVGEDRARRPPLSLRQHAELGQTPACHASLFALALSRCPDQLHGPMFAPSHASHLCGLYSAEFMREGGPPSA